MKKLASFVIVILFAFTLSAFVGCGQIPAQSGSQSSNTVPMQRDSSAPGERISVIDVGKGDCILLQAGASAALIDAGYDDTSDEVLSYLRESNVDHLKFLVITHYDKDHIGDVRALGEQLNIDMVYLPGYEGADKNYRSLMTAIDKAGLPTQSVDEELSLDLGGAEFRILPSRVEYVADAGDGEGNDNDCSLVATLRNGGDSYLFAGDLEEEGIEAYLDERLGNFDVLKVPHHGRKASNTEDFLADVQPKIAIITDSYDDPASKKTLKMLDKAGADVHRTGESGTIVIDGDGAGKYAVSHI